MSSPSHLPADAHQSSQHFASIYVNSAQEAYYLQGKGYAKGFCILNRVNIYLIDTECSTLKDRTTRLNGRCPQEAQWIKNLCGIMKSLVGLCPQLLGGTSKSLA